MRVSATVALAFGAILAVPIVADSYDTTPIQAPGFTRITPTSPSGPRRLSPARPRRSRRSLNRISFRTLRLIRPAKATRTASVATRTIATKGASTATPADRVRPQVGLRFPLEALR